MSKALRKQQQRLDRRRAAFLHRLNQSRMGVPKPTMEGHVRNQFDRGGMIRPGSMNSHKG